jgi:hypothetical protein
MRYEAVIVYADDREIDLAALAHLPICSLRTGVGKVRAAVEVCTSLSTTLREQPDLLVVSVGTAGSVSGLQGTLHPSIVTDRDSTPEELRSVGITPQPDIEIHGGDGTVLGTGDGFAGLNDMRLLAARGIELVDMETHAVLWAAQMLGAHNLMSIRHVTDFGDARDWEEALIGARTALTREILRMLGG